MDLRASLVTTAPPARVLEHVAELDRYPRWMPLVHAATRENGSAPPAWVVELRARVGPLARSKRLRMVRSVHDEGATTRIVFERAEVDGRRHAMWRLEVTVGETEGATTLDMYLAYDGRMFVSVVEAILRQNIEVGRARLAELLAD